MLKSNCMQKIERKYHTWCEIQANLVFHVLHLLLLMKKRNSITVAVQDLKFCMKTGFLPRRCIGIYFYFLDNGFLSLTKKHNSITGEVQDFTFCMKTGCLPR